MAALGESLLCLPVFFNFVSVPLRRVGNQGLIVGGKLLYPPVALSVQLRGVGNLTLDAGKNRPSVRRCLFFLGQHFISLSYRSLCLICRLLSLIYRLLACVQLRFPLSKLLFSG